MLPRYDIELDPIIPAGFRFWVPTDEDIENAGGEGLGFFRDTWLVLDVTHAEAREAVAYELTLIDAVSAIARDAAEFDAITSAAEYGDPDDIDILDILDIRQRSQWPRLDEVFPAEDGLAEGLELGVGGLAVALASVGLVPVASCRTHARRPSWSDAPVVMFATDRARAKMLQPLIARHECGLERGGEGRDQFLAISARDVRSMNALASSVLDSATEFGPGSIIARPEKAGHCTDALYDLDQLRLPGFGEAGSPV